MWLDSASERVLMRCDMGKIIAWIFMILLVIAFLYGFIKELRRGWRDDQVSNFIVPR